jgi:hypothetical protein
MTETTPTTTPATLTQGEEPPGFAYAIRFVPESNLRLTLVKDTRSPEGVHLAFTAARQAAFGPKGKADGGTLFLGTGSFLTTAILSISLVSATEEVALDEARSHNAKRYAEAEAIRRGDVDVVDEEDDDDDTDEEDTDGEPIPPSLRSRVPAGLASIGT